MSEAQEQENLIGAVDFRDLIGQAKGILMERCKITGDQAFRILSLTSQLNDLKLRDVASELVYGGTIATSRQTAGPYGAS